MVTQYKENDEATWIPVAKGKSDGPARAFLPFNGLHGRYRFGYKAASSSGHYFESLMQIQQAFLDDESTLFQVHRGTKEERQWKARWRHGNEKGSPLLGPTLGWVLVPVSDIEKISASDLERVLDAAGEGVAKLSSIAAEPILCMNPKDLERECARLFHENLNRVPAGQDSPAKMECFTEQFARDARVVAFVLRKAGGTCECCLQAAPFEKPNGLPYLEVHHVKQLASGGSDKITNAVALCPNCHRELHHGANSTELAEILYSRIERLLRE